MATQEQIDRCWEEAAKLRAMAVSELGEGALAFFVAMAKGFQTSTAPRSAIGPFLHQASVRCVLVADASPEPPPQLTAHDGEQVPAPPSTPRERAGF